MMNNSTQHYHSNSQELSNNRSIDSIRVIEQEVIEEKQLIISQLYNQLRECLNTNNLLMKELVPLKSNVHVIDLQILREKGFVRED